MQVVRINDFLGVVAEDEWTAVRAQRALKAAVERRSRAAGAGHADRAFARRARHRATRRSSTKGDAGAPLPAEAKALKATYFWPMQSHGSIGPSCAVADVTRRQRHDLDRLAGHASATAPAFAHSSACRSDKVRLIYLEGSGCYGMNGHEDAAADAAILSRAVGRPVRVQWSREDELGWDPKGPPQLLDLAGAVDADGRILDWRTEMWVPETTSGLPIIPLLAPERRRPRPGARAQRPA